MHPRPVDYESTALLTELLRHENLKLELVINLFRDYILLNQNIPKIIPKARKYIQAFELEGRNNIDKKNNAEMPFKNSILPIKKLSLGILNILL